MALQRILENVQRKGKINVSPVPQASKPVTSAPLKSPGRLPPTERKIDPVVARLKEARRLEREQKEREKQAKKGAQPPKKPKATIPLRTGPTNGSAPQKKPASRTPSKLKSGSPTIVSSRPKPTKMKFSDLMKKASSIDQSKLSINYKSKSKTPEPRPRSTNSVKSSGPVRSNGSARQTAPVKPNGPARLNGDVKSTIKPGRPNLNQDPVASVRAPLPSRGPSQALAQKLQKKQVKPDNYDDYEEDMDDFIASSEEEQEVDLGYDRDEIWAMFNRNKKRPQQWQDDYDSDDMEATGAEVFDEESRSKRFAEIEDREELEKEMRLAEMKKRRKMEMSKKR